jgi:protein involved in polysaccharide export with SLBB domain
MKKLLSTLLFLLFVSSAIHAQDILKGKDLSQVKVDQLSDGDIAKLKSQLTSNGMPIEQAEQAAIAKGMSKAEFAKLKLRLEATTDATGTGKLKTAKPLATRTNNSSDSLDTGKYDEEKKVKPLIDPLIFGSELFTAVAPNFEPNMKLATPLNYMLGPDDQLQVAVYGVQEYNGELLVSAEGNILVPNVGQIKVAGLTIEAATQKLKSIMGSGVYSYLRSGGSKLSVTLSKIRSIKVTVIGTNHPGNYNLSSLATVFNALYVAGGPSAFGSFREIELVRNNKVLRSIDLYRFLLHGDQTDNIGLQDNDVIRVPAYKKRMELQGQVKRPGIFEVLSGDSFAGILDFASGFTDTAYQSSVKIFQRNDKERKVADLEAADYSKYQPQTGDVVVASKILNRFANRVRITGSVFRPDVYGLSPGLTVAELIRKADGLKEDAFTGRGQIIRLQEDLTRSILSFDIRKALAGDAANNSLLQREDEVLISSVHDLRDSFKVTIQGEVRVPGQYDFVKNLSLKDLVVQAGGFSDAAYKTIEIARLIKRDSIKAGDDGASLIIIANIDGEGDLNSATANNIPLQAFDVITIRRKAGYTLPESVSISGQVQYPGPYVLSNRNERVSELLKRAGGLIPDAYPEGAFIKRYKTDQEKLKAQEVAKKLKKAVKDSTETISEEILQEFDKVSIDLAQIIKYPGTVSDLILHSKDELYIPKFEAQVKVSGEVLLNTQVPFEMGRGFGSYIGAAGGFSPFALKKRAYIVYANGRAARTKRFLFFNAYPKVKPGSEIVVPKAADKKSSSTAEIVGLTSGLVSLAGVVIAILKL